MEHSEAVQSKAVERYALGDLSVSEVEEFERHFFDCPQCSEELRLLSVLQENARAVFIEQSPGPRTEPEKSRVSWWTAWRQPWAWAPALAAVLVAVFAGYLTGVRRLDAPQAISSYPLIAATRGEQTVIAPPRGAQFFTLDMDRVWERDYESYTVSLRDSGGTERFTMGVGAVAPGRAIQVLIPARSLAAGGYVLTVAGNDGTIVATYPFRLQME